MRKPPPDELFSDIEFDRDHPGVYAAFVAEADALRGRGWAHYSARTIVHVLRHHRATKMGPGEPYKLNDHVSPYFARRLMAERPLEFSGFFETRDKRHAGETVEVCKA